MVEGEDKGAGGLDEGPSLDPRAMLRGPGASARIAAPSGERAAGGPQKPADETLSLDPATWASAKPAAGYRPAEPEFVKEASAAPKPSRRLIWMLGGGVVLAVGVGAGALAIRRAPALSAARAGGSPVKAPKPVTAAAPPVAASAAPAVALLPRVKVCNGEMDDQNFYSAAISAQMEDTVIPQFASALAFDFNFAFDIRPGDKFQAVYQDPDPAIPGGRPVLIYASLVTEAKSKQLWLYQVPGEAAPAWFDAAGHSAAKSLMRTPVEGAHVTSVFGPRMHPIFEKVIVHKGVDFGCPVGTSVFASADGVIEYAGIANGYGNFLKIRHSPTLETAYGHLSGYGDGIKQGVTVKQNQVVAMTGNTGNSTGPHLHYEVLQNGEPVDPLTFATEETRALAGKDFEAFLARKNAIDTARDAS